MPREDPFNTPEKAYMRDRWYHWAERRRSTNSVGFINYCTFPGLNCHDVIKLKPLLKITKTGYDKDSLTFFEKDIEIITDIRDKLPGAWHYLGHFEDFVQAASEGQNIRPDPESTEVNPFTLFPYDVVNLDYTGPGFKHKGKKTSAEMASIYTLFEIQSFKHKSFTLFLTFPAINRGDDDQGKNALNQCIINNMRQHDDFRHSFEGRYRGIDSPYYSTERRRALSYKEFLLISVPLIIINYGFQNRFDTICRERYSYIGEGNDALMVSFIFDCNYIGTNTYHAEINRLQPTRVVSIFNHYQNINEYFEANPDIRQRYTT